MKIPLAPSVVPKSEFRSVPMAPKVMDSIYGTPEYRAWRRLIIGRAQGRCQDSACTSPFGKVLFADHIVEVKDDPSRAFDLSNGMARCKSCHENKTLVERTRRLGEVT